MNLSKEKDIRLMEVWLMAWKSVANNCANKKTPTIWADQCLMDLDERFKGGGDA